MTRRFVVPALILLAACAAKPEAKRYPIHGIVKLLDGGAKTATIQHGKIGDWMEAMTMEFPVKPDTEFGKLRIGDEIDGTVVVEGDRYYVTELKVKRPAQP